jgi:hypothetical protein
VGIYYKKNKKNKKDMFYKLIIPIIIHPYILLLETNKEEKVLLLETNKDEKFLLLETNKNKKFLLTPRKIVWLYLS